MFLVFGLYFSIGLLVVLSCFLLDWNYLFYVLFDVFQNCKFRVFNAADVLLDLCLLADINCDFWSWFGIYDTGLSHIEIFDCHFFGFLVVDYFDGLSELFGSIFTLYFIYYSATCRWRLGLNLLYVAIIRLNSDPFITILQHRTELTASRNNFIHIVGSSSNCSLLVSSLLSVVRLSDWSDCCWAQNRCCTSSAIVEYYYLLLLVVNLDYRSVLSDCLAQWLHLCG